MPNGDTTTTTTASSSQPHSTPTPRSWQPYHSSSSTNGFSSGGEASAATNVNGHNTFREGALVNQFQNNHSTTTNDPSPASSLMTHSTRDIEDLVLQARLESEQRQALEPHHLQNEEDLLADQASYNLQQYLRDESIRDEYTRTKARLERMIADKQALDRQWEEDEAALGPNADHNNNNSNNNSNTIKLESPPKSGNVH